MSRFPSTLPTNPACWQIPLALLKQLFPAQKQIHLKTGKAGPAFAMEGLLSSKFLKNIPLSVHPTEPRIMPFSFSACRCDFSASTIPMLLPAHNIRQTDNENLCESKAGTLPGGFPRALNLWRDESYSSLKGEEVDVL